MNTVLIVLMCYLHQPVAIFSNNGETASLYPYKNAPLSAPAREAGHELCVADDPDLPKNFEIWHLEKLNGHNWTRK
jgi:hypothetical protein